MAQMDRFKITNVAWDSDRDPGGFTKWVNTFSALVRSTAHGAALEDYLDAKLNRKKTLRMAIPSCLTDDPDFNDDQPDGAQKVDEESDEEDNTLKNGASTISGGTAESAFGLNRAAFPFKDLSKETKDLDGMLYNILLMNVKGSKNSLLFCVKNPSYVQAIIVLSKHINISRNERKTKVLDALDQLKFTGNVQTYQIKTMELVHELFDSGVSMMDYALAKIMKSFEGKSKTIQYQIAHDINTKEIDDNLNLFDLIQGYCSQIACVGDMQVTVNTVDNNSTPDPTATNVVPD
jgi:hypothetical protein